MSELHYSAPVPVDAPLEVSDDEIIDQAIDILEKRLTDRRPIDQKFVHRADIMAYCKLHYADVLHEVFAIMFLDSSNRLIGHEVVSQGTLTKAPVYSREVVRMALKYNAASVVFTHNHPCGDTTPSKADIRTTKLLKRNLKIIGVRVFDHIIVGEGVGTSLAMLGHC